MPRIEGHGMGRSRVPAPYKFAAFQLKLLLFA
jgi:hypothetical protein